jgi:hypothetical protein
LFRIKIKGIIKGTKSKIINIKERSKMFDKFKKSLNKLAKNKNVKSLAKKGLAFAQTDEGKDLIKRGIKAAASGGASELNADNLEKLKKLKDKF